LAQVVTCSSIDGMAGFSIVFKCEQFQKGYAAAHSQRSCFSPTCCEETACSLASDSSRLACRGAFKFRGAYNAIESLSEEQKRRGVVTHSSGNHALSIALAAKLAGIPAYIVVPTTTPQVRMPCCKPQLFASLLDLLSVSRKATAIHASSSLFGS
jgi:serine racemase